MSRSAKASRLRLAEAERHLQEVPDRDADVARVVRQITAVAHLMMNIAEPDLGYNEWTRRNSKCKSSAGSRAGSSERSRSYFVP